MAYRPYPNADRALKQLARKERVVARRWVTPAGQVAEEYDFPGQSLNALAARMPSQPGLYILSTRDDEHVFEYGDDHVQRCTRCRLPHSQWSGGPCPGAPVDWKPGSYV
ncbi:predicted protein [Streptomyces viridosporus ATCC 14672]|uniref:Predicted protein n=1 Tax=Streptomyces viridosporus (strain ATCC 14672 / DSM 40746 / JCM 4963 / KCTC 9882 / NRRL B-12104 / FH 1290) TaxID=566461 RepID=D6A493_STRV1|nr:hypothetical protein [Streptomyces viridosporus]EFE65733.1 predicted protein [Streptomyces viridosporus ATCC 14672]